MALTRVAQLHPCPGAESGMRYTQRIRRQQQSLPPLAHPFMCRLAIVRSGSSNGPGNLNTALADEEPPPFLRQNRVQKHIPAPLFQGLVNTSFPIWDAGRYEQYDPPAVLSSIAPNTLQPGYIDIFRSDRTIVKKSCRAALYTQYYPDEHAERERSSEDWRHPAELFTSYHGISPLHSHSFPELPLLLGKLALSPVTFDAETTLEPDIRYEEEIGIKHSIDKQVSVCSLKGTIHRRFGVWLHIAATDWDKHKKKTRAVFSLH